MQSFKKAKIMQLKTIWTQKPNNDQPINNCSYHTHLHDYHNILIVVYLCLYIYSQTASK